MQELHLGRALQFYAAYAVLCALVLLLPAPLGAGGRVLLLVLLWNLALPALAWKLGYAEWLRLWIFLVPLSALLVLADWFFCDGLGALQFADNGSPRIGPVPLYMAGMWSIGLFLLTLIGLRLAWARSYVVALIAVVALSPAIFLPTEVLAFHLPLWAAQRVPATLEVANYVLPAEVLLALMSFVAYERLQDAGWIARLSGAAGITLAYVGAAGLSFLLLGRS